MKKTVILAIVLFHLCAGFAFGGQFGPAEPQARQGRTYVGVGYQYHADRWDFEGRSADVNQNQIFLQVHLGLFPSGEAYLKLGNANLVVDQGLSSVAGGVSDFEGKFRFYETVGLKGVFVRGSYLDIGGFAEVSLFSAYNDATVAGTRLSIDNILGTNIGLTFQRKVEGGFLYAGPFFHYLRADYSTRGGNILGGGTITGSGTLTPESYLGGFAGFQVSPSKNVVLTGELQLREAVSAGVAISFRL